MVRSLAELAILNMRTIDILYPNNYLEAPPRNSYILSDIIFKHGGRLFMHELGLRDEIAFVQWTTNGGHFCCVNEGSNEDKCWCSCNPRRRKCLCACFHCFHMLINYIIWENGEINYEAKFKLIIARIVH